MFEDFHSRIKGQIKIVMFLVTRWTLYLGAVREVSTCKIPKYEIFGNESYLQSTEGIFKQHRERKFTCTILWSRNPSLDYF